jgi:hypothetical protein
MIRHVRRGFISEGAFFEKGFMKAALHLMARLQGSPYTELHKTGKNSNSNIESHDIHFPSHVDLEFVGLPTSWKHCRLYTQKTYNLVRLTVNVLEHWIVEYILSSYQVVQYY